jgi:hypothetical protein
MDLALHQAVTLRLDVDRTLGAKLVDMDDSAIALKLDGPWEGPLPTGPVTFLFTASQFCWQAPVTVSGAFHGWWFVTRPAASDCERIQRRSFVRIAFEASAVAVPMTPAGEPTGELLALGLTNLSADGCMALCDEALLLDDQLSIYLSLPELPTTHVVGRIVRKHRREADWEYGIRFEGLTDQYQAQLTAFIQAEIAQHEALGLDITQPGG